MYVQVADLLAGRIAAGEFPPGKRIPSETTIQQTYGVSRVTARRAVAVLRERGLVRTVAQHGSFVVGAPRS